MTYRGTGDFGYLERVGPSQEFLEKLAREREEQRKWEEECREREDFKFDVQAYTELLKQKQKPHLWWRRISVQNAMFVFFFKIEDLGYDKPVIVPRRVEATVEHLCKNGRAYRLSTCVKECWNCGGSSPGCGLTPPSN